MAKQSKPKQQTVLPEKGSAVHFIEWHNKNATASNYLSHAWAEKYFKEIKD